jgi:hypothetical protein
MGGVTLGNAAGTDLTGKRSMVTTLMFALVFVAWVGEWPLGLDAVTYGGNWRSPFVVFSPLFTPIPGIRLFPWQLLLVALAPFCFVASVRRLHAVEMDRAILLSVACVLITLVWGLLRSGSPYFAYYQLWRYLAALLIAYMLMSALQAERDLIALGKIVILSALIRAALCIFYYWTHLHGKVDPLPEFVTNHDDSMLFVLAVQITWIWAIFNGGKAALVRAIIVSSLVLYAIILNDRRLAWVELLLPLPLIYFLVGAGPLRDRVNRWALIIGPLLLAYFLAGTMSDSKVFAPVRALTTTGSYEDASSLTREEENRNLLRTLVDSGNPILGKGWGQRYDKTESIYSNYQDDWILVLYTPHNSILGLAAYAGLIGFIGLWGVMPVAAYLAARGYMDSPGNAVLQSAAIAAICAVSIYSVQCYGDIGLQSFPGAAFLGAALATAARVAKLSEEVPSTSAGDGKAGCEQYASPGKLSRRRPKMIRTPARPLTRRRF